MRIEWVERREDVCSETQNIASRESLTCMDGKSEATGTLSERAYTGIENIELHKDPY